MKRIKDFFKTSLLGGLVVILPTAILLFVFRWIFRLITGLIQPLTNLVVKRAQLQEIVAAVVVIAIILAVCFLVGLLVKTKFGAWLFGALENRILKNAPGYSLVKETIAQFLGNRKSPFSSVALVRLFGNETLASAFITDTHEDGSYTVFVPTGPNPTSGNIFHLKAAYVYPVDVSMEDTMRSIISCGAGSSKLIRAFAEREKKKP